MNTFKKYGDRATINVDGQIWRVNDDKIIGSGVDTTAYVCDEYPQFVLLIFPYIYQYKYDWYKHLSLIYGESQWKRNHVLILPRMESIRGYPRWYSKLDSIVERRVLDGYNRLVSVRNSEEYEKLHPLTRFWAEELIDFLDRYPKWKSNDMLFDLHSGNIMQYGSTTVITDPIAKNRSDWG